MSLSPFMDKSVSELVIALCADFERRRCAIRDKSMSQRVLMEYKFLNLRILEATMEIVGVRDALLFIDDIGARRGYANSQIDGLSEPIYKRKKAEVKLYIAKKLALID